MSGPGPLVLAALGSVTAPSALSLSTFTAASGSYTPWGLYQAIPVPSINAVLFTHGVEAMRLYMEGASYRVGLLPPAAGMTATSTATKASATLTFSANPTDNDQVYVGSLTGGLRTITFKTTIDTTGAYGDQVKIGANLAATISNLSNFVNGTYTDGTEGWDHYKANGIGYPGYASLPGANVSVTSTTATTAVFTALTPGTTGNTYNAGITAGSSGSLTSFGTGSKMTGGAAGTGTAPDSGTYRYAAQYRRSADGALSARQTTEVELTQSVNANVSIAAIPTAPTRDAVDYNRVLRTPAGALQFYKVTDSSAATATDSSTDATLTGTLAYKYDPRDFRTREAGRPEIGRYGALWRARFWTAGALKGAQYGQGTASVTNASASVTLSINCRLKDHHIGWTFRVASHPIDYVVVEIDNSTPSAPVITLNRTYEGSTDPTAVYTLTDERNQTLPAYSQPTLYNNFPLGNSVAGVTSRDVAGAMGHVAIWNSLVVFTRTGVWRISGDTGAFQLENVAEGCGSYGGHAVQVAEGVLYWIGPDGAFRWGGAGVPEPLSRDPEDPTEGIIGTLDRINVDEADMIVSNYNSTDRKVRWWLPLDGEEENNYCLRYDISGASFALQRASAVTAAATVPGPDGQPVTLVGDAEGQVWQLDTGYSDGAYGFEPRQVLSSYTASTRTLTFSGTPLPTSGDGLKGVPVCVVSATAGTFERARVVSNTSSTAVLSAQLTTTPSASDYVVFGGIPLDIQTAQFDNEQPELYKWLEGLTLAHETESAATEVWCAAGADDAEPTCFKPDGSTVDYADASESDGEKHYGLYSPRGRALSVRLFAFVRGYALRLRGMVLSIRTPDEAEVEG